MLRIEFQEKTKDGRGAKNYYQEDMLYESANLLTLTEAELVKQTGPKLLFERVTHKYQEEDRDDGTLEADLVIRAIHLRFIPSNSPSFPCSP